MTLKDALQSGVEIELLESSGPVSPRFFYTLSLRLTADPAGATLRYTHSEKAEVEAPVSRRQLQALWNKLEPLLPLHDLVDAEVRRRIGVSLNKCSLKIGSDRQQFEYTLNGLDDHPGHAALVKALKRVAKGAASRP